MQKKYQLLIIIALGFAIYGNSLWNGFVFDDEEQILGNQLIHSINNWPQFFTGSTYGAGGTGGLTGLYYKPLLTIVYSLIYSLFGPQAFYFHLLQIIVHIANSALIYALFRTFFTMRLALFLGVVFLVHPINTEAVVYAANLQDTFFFFFGLLALLYTNRDFKGFKNVGILFVLLLLSILSKETGVLFLGVGFLYVLLLRKRNVFAFLLAALLVIWLYAILRFAIAGIYFSARNPIYPILKASLYERLLSLPQIVFFYLQTVIAPINLAISQHWVVKTIHVSNFFMPLAGDILFAGMILFGLFWVRKSKKELLTAYVFFLLWFAAGMLLHLQLFPLDVTVADRWFYFPFVGLLGMTGVAVQTIELKQKILRYILFVFACILILVLSFRTVIRNRDWKDGYTLYSHDIQYQPESYQLHNNLGVELFRRGNIDEAGIHYKRSVELFPYFVNWNNLGNVYLEKKDIKRARKYYELAMRNGNYHIAYENLALLLLKHESPKEANEFSKDAVQKLPNSSKLWMTLAVSEYRLGNRNDALFAAEQAIRLDPIQPNYLVYYTISQNQPIILK